MHSAALKGDEGIRGGKGGEKEGQRKKKEGVSSKHDQLPKFLIGKYASRRIERKAVKEKKGFKPRANQLKEEDRSNILYITNQE